MLKPEVDYRKFRWSRRNDPEFRHLKLIWGWVVYLTLFVLTERLIPYDKCHVVHSKVDDMVPFNEYFILAYISWYVLLAGTLFFFLFFDVESFKKCQIFIICTQMIAMAIYIFWPNIQQLRPETLPRRNFCSWVVSLIYSVDTPTGVMPSLHVAYSLAIMSVWMKKKETPLVIRLFISAWSLVICYSVMAVKQHSFVDIMAAVPAAALAETVVYGRKWQQARAHEKKKLQQMEKA